MQSNIILSLLLNCIAILSSAIPSGPPPNCQDDRVSAAANANLRDFPCTLAAFNSGFTTSNACEACDTNNLGKFIGPAIAACPTSETSALQKRLGELKGVLERACYQ
ncbi:hypothetical protein BC829DRAFT_461369 [Chytridium lagenaria]|nr:hypothetical protein BC829DRAFT_461369 [Chytridium lagenaria]